MRFTLDPSARLIDDDRIVIGGSPLGLFRLSPAGGRVVAALVAGGPLPPGHAPLTDRLLDAGVIHPCPEPGTGPAAADVTAVVPVHQEGPTDLTALLRGLADEGVRRAVVVDDASPTPVELDAGPIDGLTVDVVRLDRNGGPGAARNAGVALVATPVVAFVDADTVLPVAWVAPLTDHLADERVAVVAPRITAVPGGHRPRERFERWRSPLDLGPTPARVRAGSRVSYVPAAVLVVRTAAFRDVGGFAAELRFGEDVDLVWRLDEAGWRIRYEPAVGVGHRTRESIGAWARQRFDYGTSAAPLAARHPGALAPARVSGWSALSWAVGTLVSPLAGVGIAAATTAALVRKLRPMTHPFAEAGRLAGLGHLFAGRILASATTRAWWPLAVVAALVSRRARRAVVLAAVIPGLLEWRADRPELDPVTALGLRLLDDLAYGTGVWAGMARHRTIAPIRPDLTNWPGRGSAHRPPRAVTE